MPVEPEIQSIHHIVSNILHCTHPSLIIQGYAWLVMGLKADKPWIAPYVIYEVISSKGKKGEGEDNSNVLLAQKKEVL